MQSWWRPRWLPLPCELAVQSHTRRTLCQIKLVLAEVQLTQRGNQRGRFAAQRNFLSASSKETVVSSFLHESRKSRNAWFLRKSSTSVAKSSARLITNCSPLAHRSSSDSPRAEVRASSSESLLLPKSIVFITRTLRRR